MNPWPSGRGTTLTHKTEEMIGPSSTKVAKPMGVGEKGLEIRGPTSVLDSPNMKIRPRICCHHLWFLLAHPQPERFEELLLQG